MRATEFLFESSGLFGRKQGDPFVHSSGVQAEFVEVGGYPSYDVSKEQGENPGQYNTVEDRDYVIAEIEKAYGTKIQWVNAPANNSLAFAVARLQTSDGETVIWGRYFKQIAPNMMGKWKNNEVPAGWALQTKAAQKLKLGFDPQTLIGTEQQFSSSESVINQVANKSQNNEVLVDALKQTANGQKAVFPGLAEQAAGIRDYFGEIMGPIAMMSGQITGQAEQAKHALADGADWNEMAIKWPQSKNYNLVDSVFQAPNGVEIGISSKGGKGASASVKNLADSAERARTKNNRQLLNSAKYAIQVVDTVAQNSQLEGPFALGEMLGVSTPALREEFNAIKKSAKRDFEGLSQEASNLVSKINFDPSKPGFMTCWAILAGLARTVAESVNSNPEFTKGALALLNTASIVQLYTKVGTKGSDVAVTSYDAVYPPNFKGTILLDSNKNYFVGPPKGKFAFKFN